MKPRSPRAWRTVRSAFVMRSSPTAGGLFSADAVPQWILADRRNQPVREQCRGCTQADPAPDADLAEGS
jgi:hypothetical protein